MCRTLVLKNYISKLIIWGAVCKKKSNFYWVRFPFPRTPVLAPVRADHGRVRTQGSWQDRLSSSEK